MAVLPGSWFVHSSLSSAFPSGLVGSKSWPCQDPGSSHQQGLLLPPWGTDGAALGRSELELSRVFQKSSCENFPVIHQAELRGWRVSHGGDSQWPAGIRSQARGREGHVDLSPTRLPLAIHGSLRPNVRPRPYAARPPALLVSTDLLIQRPLGHLCVLQAWGC